jgi:SAM-dependent methyltransferase
VKHWQDWVTKENQASYSMPEHWTGRFDLITAHFVLEHVANPTEVLADIRRCLAPNGRLFMTVPDAEANSGDLLVVDHLNHFTASSLARLLSEADLSANMIDREFFQGAFTVTAAPGARDVVAPSTDAMAEALTKWQDILAHIAALQPKGPVAVYGAGFYGSVIAARLKSDLTCFLDRNPFLQGQTHLGVPVLVPEDCPTEVGTVIAGLNPDRARDILASNVDWLPASAALVFLDG